MAFDLSGLFAKGSVAEQMFVYGILQNVIGSLLQPLFTGLQQDAYSNTPNLALSPAQAAELSARGFLTEAAGEAIAKNSGINATAFGQMLQTARRAPDLSLVVAAYHRGLIGEGGTAGDAVGLDGALTDAGIRPEWFPIIKQALIDWPSRQEVMNSWLEGQIDESTALDWYIKAGGNPDWFQIDYNSNGSAPSPVELGEMVNRGIIPEGGEGPGVVSFHQGFLEGPWRNKWESQMLQLSKYRPPPRTITALIHEGVLDDATALKWFQGWGMDAATAAVYLASAHSGKTSAAKDLTVSNIIAAYGDKLLTADEAKQHLTALGYPSASADVLLKMADFNAAQSQVKSAITRVRSLYTGRKIDSQSATAALVALGVPAAQTAPLIKTWDLEISLDVKQLSPAAVASAFYYGVIDQGEAQADIEAMGYTPYDAWLILSTRLQGALPGKPAKGPGGTGALL